MAGHQRWLVGHSDDLKRTIIRPGCRQVQSINLPTELEITMGEFDRALAKVLVHEGGFVNHPKDPGGATNQGVTQAVYDDYRRGLGQKLRGVKLLEKGERDSIYRVRYWALINGDSLPPGVSYVVFDGAVNSGVGRSVRWLQRALGIPADGIVGPQTLVAVRNHQNHDALVRSICALRMAFLRSLETWTTFGTGWSRRVDAVRSVGQAWAMGDTGPTITYVPGGEAKALQRDAKAMPAMAFADAATGSGLGTGALAGALQKAQDQLLPLAGGSDLIGQTVAVLAFASVTLTVGGLLYRWWATRRRADLAEALS